MLRYFVINNKADKHVAVVLHDYKEGYLCCNSKKLSFYMAFNAMCAKNKELVIRDGNLFRVRVNDYSSYNLVENLISDMKSDYWKIHDQGSIVNSEKGIENLIESTLFR